MSELPRVQAWLQSAKQFSPALKRVWRTSCFYQELNIGGTRLDSVYVSFLAFGTISLMYSNLSDVSKEFQLQPNTPSGHELPYGQYHITYRWRSPKNFHHSLEIVPNYLWLSISHSPNRFYGTCWRAPKTLGELGKIFKS